MNKKFLILGAFGVAAFAALTAFGPKQDAQKAEIDAAVTSQLEEFRAAQQTACDERVAVAAKTKFDEYIAAMPAPTPAKPTAAPKKKGGAKGPKVDPLPQPTKPKTDPQKDRGGTTTPEQQKKREGTITPEQQKKRGGQSGSGNGGR